VSAELEHGEGDQGVWRGEAEPDPGDEPDFCVDRFASCVGQSVFDGGQDRGAVFVDAAGQRDEDVDAGPSGPADPSVELGAGLVGGKLEDQPQTSFSWYARNSRGSVLAIQSSLARCAVVSVAGFLRSAHREFFNRIASLPARR
jgi:hypothetical protein